MRTDLIAAAILSAFLARAANAADKITFGLSWTPQAEFGGFYQAQVEGLYNAAGLDVTFKEGGPQVNTQQLLVGGALDLALAENSFQPLNAVREKIPFVAIAAFYQKDPLVIITHPEVGAKSLPDLKGHPILLAQFAYDSFYAWMRSKYGFTDAQGRPYTFNLQPFIVDKSLSQQAYLEVEPFMLEQQGVHPVVFLLSDYGYSSYASVIMVSKKMIAEKHDVIQRFIDASIKGWYGYLDGDNKKADAAILASTSDYAQANASYAVAAFKKTGIVNSGDAKTLGIGAMTDARWKAFFDDMVKAGIYKPDLDYRAAFTTEFVDKKVGMH